MTSWTMSVTRRCSCLLACLALVACGEQGEKGSSCTVAKSDAGDDVMVVCDDGTSAVLRAPQGDGTCSVKTSSSGVKTITCSDGTSVEVSDGSDGDKGDPGGQGGQGDQGDQGTTGEPGQQGDKGDPGADGRNAQVVGAGLTIEVTEVSVPEDRHPVVKLRLLDADSHPLDRQGVYTQGSVSISFVLAHLTQSGDAVGEYMPYKTNMVTGATVGSTPPALESALQPSSENDGTWTESEPGSGSYSYRFNQELPEDYDKTATHTLAVYSSRTFEGVAYVSNPLWHFRPDGEEVTNKREVVTTAACNNCHNTLTAHGGSRRELGLCITCHVGGMNDPESGNSIEMSHMVHKIHSGASLPSVVGGTPFQIVGYRNSVHDYSEVRFPQDLQNCSTCHKGADGDHWKTALSRAACSGCHDRTSYVSPPPAGYTLHTGGQHTTDLLCADCHAEGMGPVATLETDVVKVHKRRDELPLRDNSGLVISEAPTLTGEIVSVSDTGPSDSPVVRFTVAVDGQPYDILSSPLNRLRFTFAGPTTDYAGYTQYTAQGSGAVGTLAAGASSGEFTWTVPGGVTVTDIATACGTAPEGSFAVGMEGRISGMASLPDNSQISVNYAMHNKVAYFAVTDPEAVPRRSAVVVDNCNNCHEDLAAHGGSRNDPEYCVLCHSANKDSTNVPAPSVGDTTYTASVRMSHMIHRVHRGRDGANPYIIGSHDFSEVVFPGLLKNCLNCHVKSQYELPLPDLLPTHLTQIDSDKVRVPSSDAYVQPTAAACTGCHDSDDSVAHTMSMTSALGQESCSVCHGSGASYDVDAVHATPGLYP